MKPCFIRTAARWVAIVVVTVMAAATATAQSFLSTHTLTLEKNGWSASVEFPTEGDKAVVESVKRWIADVLDIDGQRHTSFNGMLQASCDAFLASGQWFKRSVMVERSYEDEGCVTFEAMVTDRGEETWRWADCASFSKRDGHRVKLNEIFNCDTSDICRLMWQYRGDLTLDADGPDDLVPVNAGSG